MRNTKQHILNQSLELFNNDGVPSVSLRNIASKSDISIGNLQYHFNKRDEIIECLYFEIVEKVESIVYMEEDNLLKSFLDIAEKIFLISFQYRFFFLDFVSITRKNQKIRDHFKILSKMREQQFLNFLNHLIEANIFRSEVLVDEYVNLYKRIEVQSNFFMSSNVLVNGKLSNKTIHEYVILTSQSIFPFLTEFGTQEYFELFPDQKRNN